MSIIIIVKREEVEWTEDGSEKIFSEKKKFSLDSIAEMCYTNNGQRAKPNNRNNHVETEIVSPSTRAKKVKKILKKVLTD